MASKPLINRSCEYLRKALQEAFAIPLAGVIAAIAVIAIGSWRAPGGYEWDSPLNTAFVILAVGWALGLGLRSADRLSNLAATLQAICLFLALCVLATLMAAALAIGTGDFIDPTLSRLDHWLFPFLDWRRFVLSLSGHDRLLELLGQIYVSLNWQPFVLMGAAMIGGGIAHVDRFLTAWTIGLFMCILPFHWLPACGPYPYYGITLADMNGINVKLAWDAPAKLEGIRNGTIDKVGIEGVTGLVTMPSFHACAAVILICCFWRYRLLRWPAVILNVAMFAAALPIGGHYAVDLIAGGAVALFAMLAAKWLEDSAVLRIFRPHRQLRPVPPLTAVPRPAD